MQKTKIKAEIVAHSKNQQGDEVISVLCTFPRIILAEVNTHRMLSKNTSSSRAIPFNKMLESVKNDPFIPIAWQKDHSGMQGTEYFTNPLDIQYLIDTHLQGRDAAVQSARLKSTKGLTKQLCNRDLEPYMWTTMLITGPKSGWDNFFKLRCPSYCWIGDSQRSFKSRKGMSKAWKENGLSGLPHQDLDLEWLRLNKGQAEIHMMALAECIWDAYNESTPRVLKAGEWHIPFENVIVKDEILNTKRFDHLSSKEIVKRRVKISVAMAARTSYTVVGEEKSIDYEAMIGLHDRLLAQDPPHSSPLEHCCRAMSDGEYRAYTKTYPEDEETNDIRKVSLGWCNNIKGFIPYRYIIDNKTNL